MQCTLPRKKTWKMFSYTLPYRLVSVFHLCLLRCGTTAGRSSIKMKVQGSSPFWHVCSLRCSTASRWNLAGNSDPWFVCLVPLLVLCQLVLNDAPVLYQELKPEQTWSFVSLFHDFTFWSDDLLVEGIYVVSRNTASVCITWNSKENWKISILCPREPVFC